MADRLLGAELPGVDHLAYEGVIARERVELLAAEDVGAAVPAVRDLGAAAVEQERDQRRARNPHPVGEADQPFACGNRGRLEIAQDQRLARLDQLGLRILRQRGCG